MNKNLDNFFSNILECLTNYYGKGLEIKNYYLDQPYGILLKKGFEFIKEGYSPLSMQSIVEYEKIKIMNEYNLNDTELFEVILTEKIVCCVHSGTAFEVAFFTQNFASNEIYTKYNEILNRLLDMEPKETPTSSTTLYLAVDEEDLK